MLKTPTALTGQQVTYQTSTMQTVSTLRIGNAFRGRRLHSGRRHNLVAPVSPLQVYAAAPTTQRLKPGAKKPPPKKPRFGTQLKTGTKQANRGTQRTNRGGVGTLLLGTQAKKKLTSIANLSKEASFRERADSVAAPRLLSRLEQLRLLSKLEDLKILSLLQRNGITLTFIEQSGLLELSERLGLLSAFADRKTPGLLFANAAFLYALAPAAVYLIPDNSNWLIAAQAIVVAIGAFGGTAAFAGGSLLSTLQKDAK